MIVIIYCCNGLTDYSKSVSSSHWVYDKAVVTGGGSPDDALVICGTYLLIEGCHSGWLRKLWWLGTGVPFTVGSLWWQGCINKNASEFRESITQQCHSIIWATFWMISEIRFGSTHGIPESWHPFFDIISESRIVNTHSVVEHTTFGILIY